MKQNKGFTLIELLIVVAIIAILAAIAVPNFLEAQTRAKVARAKSDLRSYATAIEAYAVDNNRPPREYDDSPTKDGLFNGKPAGGIVSKVLSTPIAYITTAFGLDPFVRAGDNLPEDEKIFTYASVHQRGLLIAGTPAQSPWFFGGSGGQSGMQLSVSNYYGAWYLMSIGPDRSYYNNALGQGRAGIVGREYIAYDATNGTISYGNIIRSQKRSDSDQPKADGALLGPH